MYGKITHVHSLLRYGYLSKDYLRKIILIFQAFLPKYPLSFCDKKVMFRDTLCYKHFHFLKHIPMYMGVCIIHHLAGVVFNR